MKDYCIYGISAGDEDLGEGRCKNKEGEGKGPNQLKDIKRVLIGERHNTHCNSRVNSLIKHRHNVHADVLQPCATRRATHWL